MTFLCSLAQCLWEGSLAWSSFQAVCPKGKLLPKMTKRLASDNNSSLVSMKVKKGYVALTPGAVL